MSQDIVADALNMMRNGIKSGKKVLVINRISNLLVEVLKIMKQEGAVKKYKIDAKQRGIEITIGDISECRAIKPRFTVTNSEIEKYVRRYLPARNMGIIIVSTSKGLMTHEKAVEEGAGGCLIAYFY